MSIQISWLPNPEPNITGYCVYRSTTIDGAYTLIYTTPDETYTAYSDPDGVIGNWYKIKAFDNATPPHYSDFSEPMEATSPPTCRVYGNIRDLTDTAIEDAEITAKTNPRELVVSSTNVVISDQMTAITDENGWFQIFLYPNELLTPANSNYIFGFRTVTGTEATWEYERRVEVPVTDEVNFITLDPVVYRPKGPRRDDIY